MGRRRCPNRRGFEAVVDGDKVWGKRQVEFVVVDSEGPRGICPKEMATDLREAEVRVGKLSLSRTGFG